MKTGPNAQYESDCKDDARGELVHKSSNSWCDIVKNTIKFLSIAALSSIPYDFSQHLKIHNENLFSVVIGNLVGGPSR